MRLATLIFHRVLAAARSRIINSLVATSVIFPIAYADLPPPKDYTGPECGTEPIVERAPQCGVELFQALSSENCPETFGTVTDSRCGVASYHTARHPACGVELYREGTSTSCGEHQEEFWSNWGESCPGIFQSGALGAIPAIGTGQSEVRAHRVGFKVTFQQRTRCRGVKPRTCRHEDFGPEVFRACAVPENGVAAWGTCTVPTGREVCRHPSHAPELYLACQTGTRDLTCKVRFSPPEFETWLDTKTKDVSFKVQNLVGWSAAVQKELGDAKSLGCLVQRLSTDPVFTGNVIFDASVLAPLMDDYRSMTGKEFLSSDFSTEKCLAASSVSKNIKCAPQDPSRICQVFASYENARTDLEDLANDLATLREDKLAQTTALIMARILSLDSTVRTNLENFKKTNDH